MKNVFTLILCLFCLSLFAQDQIVLRDGEEILGKVIEITPSYIKYKRANHLDGPTISLEKTLVFWIKYANGHKEIINELKTERKEKTPVSTPPSTPISVQRVTSSTTTTTTRRSYSRSDYANEFLLFAGAAVPGGDTELSTGLHLGLERTSFFSDYFGVVGHVSMSYLGLDTYVSGYGDISGGILSSLVMLGLKGETESDTVSFYASLFAGAAWASPGGDLVDLGFEEAFHGAFGIGTGLVFNDTIEIGLRYNLYMDSDAQYLQALIGYRF